MLASGEMPLQVMRLASRPRAAEFEIRRVISRKAFRLDVIPSIQQATKVDDHGTSGIQHGTGNVRT